MTRPTPTHLRVLQGNPGKRPLPKNEPMPGRPARVPMAPRWLEEDAKRVWRQHARALWEAGLLTGVDVDALATLCEVTALYKTAVAMLARDGHVWTSDKTGYTQASAWVSIRNQALKQMQSLWGEFGMTPSSRTRIQVEPQEKEADGLAQLLNRRAGASGE